MASNSSSKRPGMFRRLQAMDPNPLVIVAHDEAQMWSERKRFLTQGWAEDWSDELPMPGEHVPFPMVIVGYRDRVLDYMVLWAVYRDEAGKLRSSNYASPDRYKRSKIFEEAQIAKMHGYPNQHLWQDMRLRAEIIAKEKKI